MISVITSINTFIPQLLSSDYKYIIETTRYSQTKSVIMTSYTSFATSDWTVDPANKYNNGWLFVNTNGLKMTTGTGNASQRWDIGQKVCAVFLKTSANGSITGSFTAEIRMYPSDSTSGIYGACGIVLGSTAVGTLTATYSSYRFCHIGRYYKNNVLATWLCYYGEDTAGASARPATRKIRLTDDYDLSYEQNYEYIWKIYYKVWDNNLYITLNNVLVVIESNLAPAPTRIGILGVESMWGVLLDPYPIERDASYTCTYFTKTEVS